MQRINSVKLHTLTPGFLCHTHILTQTHCLHNVSTANLLHVHPSSSTLSDTSNFFISISSYTSS